MDRVEEVFPRSKCKYTAIRKSRETMIEMQTLYRFSDFDINLKVIKKFMARDTLTGVNKIHEKELIYEELKKLYEPASKAKRNVDLDWDVIDE